MARIKMYQKGVRITLLLVIALVWQTSLADSAQLAELQQQIDSLQNQLKQTQTQQTTISQQLSQAEHRLGESSSELHKTQQQLARQRHLYHQLQQTEAAQRQQLQSKKTQLAQQLHAIYTLEQPPSLWQSLLSTHDVNTQQRLFTYYQYWQHHHLQHIAQLENSLQQITHNKQSIDQRTQQLHALQHQEQAITLKLAQAKMQQQQALRSLKTTLQTQNHQLQQLLANKQNLQKVITQLQHQPRFSLFKFAGHQDFASQQGRLPWPTRGVITAHFGSPLGPSQLKWTDVFIQAPTEQSIYTVASGKVIFANYMTGYGLLMIIDHGNGYMTLYGYNHSLYPKVGATVKAGQLIATVGHSGDNSKSGLYFGIRWHGKPLNPEQWCA